MAPAIDPAMDHGDPATQDWLDQLFSPTCPPCIRQIIKDEAIDSALVFSGLLEDEVKELCKNLKIGHRVKIRDAYHKIKRRKKRPQSNSSVICETKPNQSLIVGTFPKRRRSSSVKRITMSYIFTCGVKRSVGVDKWSRDGKYPMTKLTIEASYTYNQLLDSIKQSLDIQTDSRVLLDSNNEKVDPETFSVESYVRNKRIVGCTRVYIAVTDRLMVKPDLNLTPTFLTVGGTYTKECS